MSPEAVEANRINGRKGGRPPRSFWPESKKITLQALKYCPEAIQVFVHEMRHCENPSVRLQAARELLDRGLGKATHRVEAASGQLLNQLIVYTGVPEPDREPLEEPDVILGDQEPVEEEDRFLIEGEAVKEEE